MEFLKKIFRRKRERKGLLARPLRIDGCRPTLTPQPDDAELAAQALLETRADNSKGRNNDKGRRRDNDITKYRNNDKEESAPRDAAYYRELSERIKAAHEQNRRSAMRYVSYCEQELSGSRNVGVTKRAAVEISKSRNNDVSTGEKAAPDFAGLEHGLFKWQDTVDREGGELLKRWQHCLAECIVRQMSATSTPTERDKDDTGQPLNS